jgi:hypothetical protein
LRLILDLVAERPDELRRPNGERAWLPHVIERAVSDLVARDRAILGGELWVVLDDGTVYGLVPYLHDPTSTIEDNRPWLWHWDCKREPLEEWRAFCERAGREAVEAVSELPYEAVPEEFRQHLYVNLTDADESEWNSLVAQLRRRRP